MIRVRFHIIRNARIENVGQSQSCMVSKLRIIWKQIVEERVETHHAILTKVFAGDVEDLFPGTIMLLEDLRRHLVLGEGVFLDQQGVRPAVRVHVRIGIGDSRLHPFLKVRQHLIGDRHLAQQMWGDTALDLMLRLVLLPWLTTPANHQEHRNGVHLGVGQREDRVHNVAQTRVLQVDHGSFLETMHD